MKLALISVYDKTNIIELAKFLLENDYQIISSGGTYKLLYDNFNDNRIKTVESYTGFPEILGGRVKTLHPKISAGILATTSSSDTEDLLKHNIERISIVICNLYPFKDTILKEHTHNDAIENIDIGGVTLIRAAFKNYNNVIILSNPKQYETLYDIGLDDFGLEERLTFATQSMEHISNYDIDITQYFNKDITYRQYNKQSQLKYGCNPHQTNSFIYKLNGIDYPIKVLNGNPGYINYIDAIQSWCLVCELRKLLNKPCAASFKHTAPAGVGTFNPISEIYNNIYNIDSNKLNKTSVAFIRARTSDPLSSFGDFIAISEIIDTETALLIKREVSDGIIALGYTEEAYSILETKKKGKYIIIQGDLNIINNLEFKEEFRELNGIGLSQSINLELTDNEYFNNIKTTINILPDNAKNDLIIANTTLKYTPSNSIVYSYDGQVIGVGAGQQNRVDCVKLAGRKARKWILTTHPKTINMLYYLNDNIKRQDKINIIIQYLENDFTDIEYKNWLSNFVNGYAPDFISKEEEMVFIKDKSISLASDAFFPFKDNIDKCSQYGVKYILQPGGSIADESIINTCNEYGILMCMSGKRVFTH